MSIKKAVHPTTFNRRQFMTLAGGIGAATMLPAFLSACGNDDEKTDSGAKGTNVSLLTFGGETPDIVNEFGIEPYERDFPGNTASITEGTAAAIYPKLKIQTENPIVTGGMFNNSYDAKGVVDGLWADYDLDILTNAKEINRDTYPKSGAIPMALQCIGIIYNPDHVDNVESWLDFFKPEYKGKIGMQTGQYDPYKAVAHVMGYKDSELSKAIDEFAKHRDNIGAWVNGSAQSIQVVSQGDVWIGTASSSNALAAIKNGTNIKFAVPSEGVPANTQVLRIVKNLSEAQNTATNRVLNYFLSEPFQQALLERQFITPSSSKVKVTEEYQKLGVLTQEQVASTYIQFDDQWLAENLQSIQLEVEDKLGGQ